MANFGWSLPPGCGTLPGEEPEAPDHYCCPHCSSRLREKHDRAEPWWDWQPYDPNDAYQRQQVGRNRTRMNAATLKHEYLADAGTTLYWNCPSCGKEVPEGQIKPIYWDDINQNFDLLHISDINERYESYQEWESAASSGKVPRETTGLPQEVLELMAQRGLEINGDWYWVERSVIPEDGDDMETWTNVLGFYLVYTYGDGVKSVSLMTTQFTKASGSNGDAKGT